MSNEFGLTAYFNLRLETLGFDTEPLEIYYSLGYCQGDGVAFYGRIYESGLLELFKRATGLSSMEVHTKEHFRALQEIGFARRLLEEAFISCEIEGKNSRCHHEHSMRFNLELSDFPESTDADWEAVAVRIEEVISEYLTQCSIILRDEGYAVIEAGGPDYNDDPLVLTRFGCNDKGQLIRFEVRLIETDFGVDECPAFDFLADDTFQSILSDISSYKKRETRWSAFQAIAVLVDDEGDDLKQVRDWFLVASFDNTEEGRLDVAEDVLAEITHDISMFHPSHSHPPIHRECALAVIDCHCPLIVSGSRFSSREQQSFEDRPMALVA